MQTFARTVAITLAGRQPVCRHDDGGPGLLSRCGWDCEPLPLNGREVREHHSPAHATGLQFYLTDALAVLGDDAGSGKNWGGFLIMICATFFGPPNFVTMHMTERNVRNVLIVLFCSKPLAIARWAYVRANNSAVMLAGDLIWTTPD